MATVMYVAPPGDEKVVEYIGVEFFNEQAMELDADQHQALLLKASGNPHFIVEGFEAPAQPKRRGRPPKADAADEGESA